MCGSLHLPLCRQEGLAHKSLSELCRWGFCLNLPTNLKRRTRPNEFSWHLLLLDSEWSVLDLFELSSHSCDGTFSVYGSWDRQKTSQILITGFRCMRSLDLTGTHQRMIFIFYSSLYILYTNRDPPLYEMWPARLPWRSIFKNTWAGPCFLVILRFNNVVFLDCC